ncbi:MAG TPA: PIN domain-containing protein [Pyrinomonadaceae bacterium]|nr:PIN domain-containing protein [Pyrinomonadaceae bacterium]
MTEAFVDTSFVIALINKTDQYHSEALQLAVRFDKQPLVTTDAVLLEIGNALARNFKAQSVQIIEHFISSDEIQIVGLNTELFRRAFELYRSHDDKAWGLVDCISSIVMKDLKLTRSLTADKDFERAGFEILIGK